MALENGLALHSDLNQLYEKLAAFADNGQLSIFSGNWFDADGGEAYVDNPEANLILTSHYLEALKMQARSSEMAALLGGKMPHVMTSIPGGNMWVPTESKLDDLLAMATEVRDWVNDTVLADTVMLAKLYPEVLTFGKGCGRYIAWGVFEGPDWPYGDNYTEQMLNRYLPMAVLDEQFQRRTCRRTSSPSTWAAPGTRAARPTPRRTSSPIRTSPSTTSTTATAG